MEPFLRDKVSPADTLAVSNVIDGKHLTMPSRDPVPGGQELDEDALNEAVLARLDQFSRKGGPDVLSEVLKIYLEDAPCKLQLLAASSVEQQSEVFVETVHGLKSSSANVGATRLASLCAVVERDFVYASRAQREAWVEAITREYEIVSTCLRQRLSHREAQL